MPNIKKAYDLFPDNTKEDIKLLVCNACGWSVSTFHRKILNYNSVSPAELMELKRIFREKASSLIRDLQKSMEKPFQRRRINEKV
jgi:hypothetical protein